jgi:flagellin glycosyltransferase Maf-like protein/6-hydroxymethylpterin diphosphokinase MptE-like protein
MTAIDRAAGSRTAFAARFPEIATALDNEVPQSTLVFEDGEPVDIDIGNQRLYGGPARHHAAEQVDAFLAKPLRLLMEAPDAAGLVSDICVNLKLAMERALADAEMTEIARGPLSAPTFLIIFGLGLGQHVEELIRRTGARWVVIVEPVVEFIAHSFHTVDWQRIFNMIDDAGGALQFFTHLDPGQVVGAIMNEVGVRGTPYLDGTWVFTHYPLWTFAEAGKRLHGAAEYAYVNRGFFEDEIVMMTNAMTNFATHPFWLLDGKPRRHRPETAVLVGAGPSLDESIETIHQIRDRVVLFSCGTALRPLLRNSLVPDFHCELENGPQVHEVIDEARSFGDLSSVRLIASATVDPRIAPLFGETIFFFRDSVSSTRILQGEISRVSGAAPTCVNTAMATAAALGFTDFVLFGVDCGTRPGMPDHAEGTVYRDIEKWQKYLERRARYPLEVEGNFGGITVTNWVYDASRRMLIDLIRVYNLNAINCSDGALITGAIPRVPESLEVEGPVLDHEGIIAALKRTMAHYQPGELVRAKNLAELKDKSQKMYDDLRAILAGFDPDAAEFAAVFDAMARFLRDAGSTYRYAHAIPDGSLSALPRIAMFYGCRSELPMRQRLFATFMDEFRRALDEMETQTDALLERLIGVLASFVPAA